MASRINSLTTQIQTSKKQQAATESSIHKVLEFLGQVYSSQGAPTSALSSMAQASTKRPRLEHHTEPLIEPLESFGASESDAIEALDSRGFDPMGGAAISNAIVPLTRQISLGQQAALRMRDNPSWQEAAMQILSNPELQDEAIAQIGTYAGPPTMSRSNSMHSVHSEASDIESFLWDFLEEQQSQPTA